MIKDHHLLEGVWTIEGESDLDLPESSSVLIFEGFRIFGGNAHYIFLGTYNLKNDRVNGQIEVLEYRDTLSSPIKRAAFVCSGDFTLPRLLMEGSTQGKPQSPVRLMLTRRMDLPRSPLPNAHA
ncbi:MAG: hypothetical protein ACOY5C_01220 [Pseudomonadota bacterium]